MHLPLHGTWSLQFCRSSSSSSSRNLRQLHSSSTLPLTPIITNPLSLSPSPNTAFLTPYPNPDHHLFDETPQRDVFSWTAKISSLARSGQKGKAVGLFKSMFRHGVRPNYVTILCTVHAVTGSEEEETMKNENGGMHTLIIKLGFGSEPSVVTALLRVYSSLGEMAMARKLFNEVPVKDLIMWTAMVTECSKNGRYTEALNTFREMVVGVGVEPNEVTLIGVLLACGYSGALLLGKQIHGYAVKREFYSETSLQNSLVDLYGKLKWTDTSVALFERIPEKDVISWKTVICGCTDNGRPRESLIFFLKMRASGITPGVTIVQNVLAATSQAGDLRLGSSLHCYVIKVSFSGSMSIGTTLLRMYADFWEVEIARELFDQLHHKDLIAWSAMVSVYARGDRPLLALETFRQMEQANEITLVSLLQACTSMGAEKHGKSIHAHVIRSGCWDNVYITSALIDFYCKVGMLWQGEALFEKLQHKDMVCWSSMINGYGINGCGEEAIKTFHDMLKQGMKPNEVVFVSVLSACSHCGLIDEGWKWFYSMEDKYHFRPSMAHYSCIVDMLSRQGRIQEAIKFINNMPMEPDATVWGALLAGCRVSHGDIEAAEIAAKQLFILDPKNGSYYIALSNMYADLGKWGDVERIRKLIEDKGLGKMSGCSMV